MVHYLMTLRNTNMSVEITLYVGLYRSELITLSLSLSLSLSVQGGVLGKQGLMITTFMLDRCILLLQQQQIFYQITKCKT